MAEDNTPIVYNIGADADNAVAGLKPFLDSLERVATQVQLINTRLDTMQGTVRNLNNLQGLTIATRDETGSVSVNPATNAQAVAHLADMVKQLRAMARGSFGAQALRALGDGAVAELSVSGSDNLLRARKAQAKTDEAVSAVLREADIQRRAIMAVGDEILEGKETIDSLRDGSDRKALHQELVRQLKRRKKMGELLEKVQNEELRDQLERVALRKKTDSRFEGSQPKRETAEKTLARYARTGGLLAVGDGTSDAELEDAIRERYMPIVKRKIQQEALELARQQSERIFADLQERDAIRDRNSPERISNTEANAQRPKSDAAAARLRLAAASELRVKEAKQKFEQAAAGIADPEVREAFLDIGLSREKYDRYLTNLMAKLEETRQLDIAQRKFMAEVNRRFRDEAMPGIRSAATPEERKARYQEFLTQLEVPDGLRVERSRIEEMALAQSFKARGTGEVRARRDAENLKRAGGADVASRFKFSLNPAKIAQLTEVEFLDYVRRALKDALAYAKRNNLAADGKGFTEVMRQANEDRASVRRNAEALAAAQKTGAGNRFATYGSQQRSALFSGATNAELAAEMARTLRMDQEDPEFKKLLEQELEKKAARERASKYSAAKTSSATRQTSEPEYEAQTRARLVGRYGPNVLADATEAQINELYDRLERRIKQLVDARRERIAQAVQAKLADPVAFGNAGLNEEGLTAQQSARLQAAEDAKDSRRARGVKSEFRRGYQNRNPGEAITGRFNLVRDYAAIGALGMVASNSATFIIDLEKAMAQLQAITASTDGTMLQLGKTIRNLSIDVGTFSAQQVAQAATMLAQAGYSAAEIGDRPDGSRGILSNSMLLSTATGTDMGLSTDVMTSALSVFKLQGEESGRVADVLTQAMNLSKLSVDKFALGLQYAGNIAHDAGVSFDEITVAMAGMANQGVRSGSTLGTGLRQLLIDLQTPSKEAVGILQSKGVDLDDIDVRARGLIPVLTTLRDANIGTAEALQIFEVRAASAYSALVNDLPGMVLMQQQLNNVGAASQAAAIQTETFAAAWTRFTNAAGYAGQAVFSQLMGGVKALMDNALTPMLKFLSETEGAGAVTAALIGSLVTGFAAFAATGFIRWAVLAIGAVSGITAATATATGGLAAFGLAMRAIWLANPIGLFIGVAAAVIGTAVSLISFYDAASKAQRALNSTNKLLEEQQGEYDKTQESIVAVEDQLERVQSRFLSLSDVQLLNADATGQVSVEHQTLQSLVLETEARFSSLRSETVRNINTVEDLAKVLINLQIELSRTAALQAQVLKGTAERKAAESGELFAAKGDKFADRYDNLLGMLRRGAPGPTSEKLGPIFEKLKSGEGLSPDEIEFMREEGLPALKAAPRYSFGGSLLVQNQGTIDKAFNELVEANAAAASDRGLARIAGNTSVNAQREDAATKALAEITNQAKIDAQRLQELNNRAYVPGLTEGQRSNALQEAKNFQQAALARLRNEAPASVEQFNNTKALQEYMSVQQSLELGLPVNPDARKRQREIVERQIGGVRSQMGAAGVSGRPEDVTKRQKELENLVLRQMALEDKPIDIAEYSRKQEARAAAARRGGEVKFADSLTDNEADFEARINEVSGRSESNMVRANRAARGAGARAVDPAREAEKLKRRLSSNKSFAAKENLEMQRAALDAALGRVGESSRIGTLAERDAVPRAGSGKTFDPQGYLNDRSKGDIVVSLGGLTRRSAYENAGRASAELEQWKISAEASARAELATRDFEGDPVAEVAALAAALREIDLQANQFAEKINQTLNERIYSITSEATEDVFKAATVEFEKAATVAENRVAQAGRRLGRMNEPVNRGKFDGVDQAIEQRKVYEAETQALRDMLDAQQKLRSEAVIAALASRQQLEEAGNTLTEEQRKALEAKIAELVKRIAELEASIGQTRDQVEDRTTVEEPDRSIGGILNRGRERLEEIRNQRFGQSWDLTLFQGIESTIVTAADGINEALSSIIMGTEEAGDAFRKLGLTIVKSLVDAAVKVLTDRVIQMMLDLIIQSIPGGTPGGAPPSIPRLTPGRSSGGYIPGMGTRDLTLTPTQPGEFVIRKTAAEMIGSDTLNSLNMTGAASSGSATRAVAKQIKKEPDFVNIWLTKEDQVPPPSAKDIVMTVQQDILQGGSTKALIRRVAMGQV